jgi:hypothetical protein
MEAEWFSKDEYALTASSIGIRMELEGPGYTATRRMLDKALDQAQESGDPFTDEEIAVLEAHILAVEPTPEEAVRLQNKVIRHARSALRRDLTSGPTTKIGLLAKWPTSWLSDYRAAIEGNCPMLFAGVIQNAFAPDGRLWKP